MQQSRRSPFPDAPPDAVVLRILATSDLHVHLEPWDYYADRPDDGVGLVRTATLIRTARAEVPNCLLFDNGDFLQGNPLGEYLAADPARTGAEGHAIIRAMNLLDYDAAALGNHEFNYGLDYLRGCLATARFPVVCANAETVEGPETPSGKTFLPPSVILERSLVDGAGNSRRLRIGVIGVLPPQTALWDRRHLEGRIRTRDMVEAVRARLPALRRDCDLVVLLAHTGIGPEQWTFGMENAALPLAALDGVDAIVTGHTHQIFPDPASSAEGPADPQRGTLHGKPAVMPGLWGSHLGVIDLCLTETPQGWRVSGQNAALRPIATRGGSGTPLPCVPSHAGVSGAVAGQHRAALAHLRTPIGTTPVAVTSYFSLLANDLALQTVMDAQADFVRARIAHLPEAGLPLLSAAAPLKTGGPAGPGFFTDIPAGEVAMRHVADLYQFPNTLRAIRVTGADLLEWLERSAGLFARLEPGKDDQPLICPEFARYNFDVISGLSYRIDLSATARHSPSGETLDPSATRIRNLCCQGRPVRLTDRFIVATNNYRTDGGGGFAAAMRGQTLLAETRPTQSILHDWIAARGRLADRVEPVFSFAPLPGVSALYPTGARAAEHRPAIPGLNLRLRHVAPDGALVYAVTFPGDGPQPSTTT